MSDSAHHTAIASPAEIVVLCEDLQAALTAASRLQQRALTVRVLDSHKGPMGGVDAVVIDMNLHNAADPQAHVARWTTAVAGTGCARIELRFDTLMRGRPAEAVAGLLQGGPWQDPLLLVVPAYPSAGRVCIDGQMLIPTTFEAAPEVSVAPTLFPGQDVGRISLDEVTAGTAALRQTIRAAHERGVRRLVVDATTDAHLVTVAATADALVTEGVELVTASSGGWLRFYPGLGSDGFVIVAGPGQHEMDRAQLRQIADAFGGRSLLSTASDTLSGSDTHLLEVITRHRIVMLHAADNGESDSWLRASDFGKAVRRLLELSLVGNNPCVGVITTGGLTTSAVIRALEADDLRVGQELEPLCPVVRLVGGPFDDLPVINKASGIGSVETPVRLIKRLIGT